MGKFEKSSVSIDYSDSLVVKSTEDTISHPQDMAEKYPIDCANFPNVLNDELEQFIVRNGPCKPCGPFPKDVNQNNRVLFRNILCKNHKNRVENITRALLFIKKNVVCCEDCLFFFQKEQVFDSMGWWYAKLARSFKKDYNSWD